MALQWFEADGTTPLGSINMGTIAPGETYSDENSGVAKQVVLKNTGLATLENVAIEINAVSTFPANEYVLIATGESQPESESFVGHEDDDLAIGELEADASAKVWIDMSVPLAAPRRLAQMVSLRAYGEEQTES